MLKKNTKYIPSHIHEKESNNINDNNNNNNNDANIYKTIENKLEKFVEGKVDPKVVLLLHQKALPVIKRLSNENPTLSCFKLSTKLRKNS